MSVTWAGTCTKTKKLTATGVISTANKPARVWAISLQVGSSDSSITIKNGGTGSTAMWAVSNNAVATAGDATISVSFAEPIMCTTDAYGTLAGTDAVAWILYDEAS